jgi:hypothetical protein
MAAVEVPVVILLLLLLVMASASAGPPHPPLPAAGVLLLHVQLAAQWQLQVWQVERRRGSDLRPRWLG